MHTRWFHSASKPQIVSLKKKKTTARSLQIYGTWNRPANNGGFMIQFRVRVVSAQVSSSVSCRSPHPHCQPIFSQWFCSCFWFLCQADGDVVTVLRASARFFSFFCWKYILQQLELTSGKGARWPYVFFFCIKQLERMWLAKAWHGTMWQVKHVENPWAWGGQWTNQNGNVIKLYKIYMRTRVVRQCFSFQTCSLFHVVASK